jgi:hypothetical protein
MSYSTRIREDTGAVNVPEDMMSYSKWKRRRRILKGPSMSYSTRILEQ